MSEHKHRYADEATRRRWHTPESLLPMIGLREGMVFVDVGCGDGFFAVPAAEFVGHGGKVFAVDSDASAIERLKAKAAVKGLTNIEARVAEAEETVFCESCADIVFFSIVLHDFAEPRKVLLNARRMVKASGVLVNLDWKKVSSPFGPPVKIRFSEPEAVGLIEEAGFKVKNVSDLGQYHYLIAAAPSV